MHAVNVEDGGGQMLKGTKMKEKREKSIDKENRRQGELCGRVVPELVLEKLFKG